MRISSQNLKRGRDDVTQRLDRKEQSDPQSFTFSSCWRAGNQKHRKSVAHAGMAAHPKDSRRGILRAVRKRRGARPKSLAK
jgi:hypothetical protein